MLNGLWQSKHIPVYFYSFYGLDNDSYSQNLLYKYCFLKSVSDSCLAKHRASLLEVCNHFK